MTLTTAGPPPAGVYWNAVILTSMAVGVEPGIRIAEFPETGFNVNVVPQLRMQPPVSFDLRISPLVVVTGGTRRPAQFNMVITPQIHWIPSTAFTVSVTPSLSMSGRQVLRGRQMNVAVQRASTY